jgi:hypothetical protein
LAVDTVFKQVKVFLVVLAVVLVEVVVQQMGVQELRDKVMLVEL